METSDEGPDILASIRRNRQEEQADITRRGYQARCDREVVADVKSSKQWWPSLCLTLISHLSISAYVCARLQIQAC